MAGQLALHLPMGLPQVLPNGQTAAAARCLAALMQATPPSAAAPVRGPEVQGRALAVVLQRAEHQSGAQPSAASGPAVPAVAAASSAEHSRQLQWLRGQVAEPPRLWHWPQGSSAASCAQHGGLPKPMWLAHT